MDDELYVLVLEQDRINGVAHLVGDCRVYQFFKLNFCLHLVVQDALGDVHQLDYYVLMVVIQEFAFLYLDKPVSPNLECVIVALPEGLLVTINVGLVEYYKHLLF